MQTTSPRPDKLHAATKPIVRLTQLCSVQVQDSFRACTALMPEPCCMDWTPSGARRPPWASSRPTVAALTHKKTHHYELENGWCATGAGAQRGQREANTSHPKAGVQARTKSAPPLRGPRSPDSKAARQRRAGRALVAERAAHAPLRNLRWHLALLAVDGYVRP